MNDTEFRKRLLQRARKAGLGDGGVDALNPSADSADTHDSVDTRVAADALRKGGFSDEEIIEIYGYNPLPFDDGEQAEQHITTHRFGR